MRRTLAVLTTLTIVAAACGSDPDDAIPPGSTTEATSDAGATASSEDTGTSESTATSEGTTPQSTEPQSTTPATNPPPPGTPGHVCPHLKDVLLALTLQETLPRADGDLTRITAPEGRIESLSLDDINTLAGQGIGLYRVPEGQDPLAVALELSNNGVPAAPDLLVTPAVHWTFGPGGPYHDETGDLLLTDLAEPDDVAPVVGVVDTGYSESAVPWVASHVEAANQNRDAENATSSASGDITGHGAFVASLIARNTPEARVIVAGMANVPPDDVQGVNQNEFDPALDDSLFEGAAAQFGLGYSSDELQLYSAVRRLLAKQSEQGQRQFTFSALNLSVGSYQCDTLNDQGIAVWAALQLWYDNTNGAPVIAAAGNHGPLDPNEAISERDFIPGQAGSAAPVVGIPTIEKSDDPSATPGKMVVEMRALYGVQSVDSNSVLSNFSNVGAVSAMGENLCGVRVDGKHTTWSGSSFATAVVTAAITADRNVDLSDPIGSLALSNGCTPPG
jgi:hypothetical protein